MPFPTEPKAVRRSAAAAGVCACVLAAWFTYQAAAAEITGRTKYPGGRGSRIVTRENSPSEFRRGTNVSWGASAFCATVAVASFVFYVKLGTD